MTAGASLLSARRRFPVFTPVLIATESPATNTEDGCRAAPAIELEFTGKVRVRIPVSVAPELAAAVVKALSRR
jgi:hypothetical protein